MRLQLLKIIILSFIFLFQGKLICQDSFVRKYNTQEYMKLVEKEYPKYSDNKLRIENASSEFCRYGEIEPASLSFVFHVLWQDQSQKIKREIIYKEVDLLNDNFNKGVYLINRGDPDNILEKYLSPQQEISFCVADNEVVGNYDSNRKNINYRYVPNSKKWHINNEMKKRSSRGADAIQTQYLINVWILDLEDENAGFSQLPGGEEKTDGIVIDYQFFGAHEKSHEKYSKGATFTHLVANYLNILDLWNDDKSCGDDLVQDTPIQNAPNTRCPSVRHISTCSKDYFVEMTMNYMDNTPDDCQFMFTHGQKKRMHYTLSANGPRYNLRKNGCEKYSRNDMEELVEREIFDDEKFIVSIYPNPVIDILNIDIEGIENRLEIDMVNTSGLNVYSSIINSNGIHKINLEENLAPGIYFIKCTDIKTGDFVTKRVILN